MSAIEVMRSAAKAWDDTQARITSLRRVARQHAKVLEAAADAYLEARHKFQRARQYATLDHITDEGPYFEISNGIDHQNDFAVSIPWERLAMEPDDVAAEWEREQQKAELTAAKADAKRANQRLKRAQNK